MTTNYIPRDTRTCIFSFAYHKIERATHRTEDYTILNFKTAINTACLIFLIVITSACSSMSIEQDWDDSLDFSQFKTFALPENQDISSDPLIDQLIRNALVTDLSGRGMTKVQSQSEADLTIVYTVVTEERTSYQTIHTGFSTRHGLRRNSMHFRASTGTSRSLSQTFTIGTLFIAMYQLSNGELVWEGTASDIVSPNRDAQHNEQVINDAIKRMLEGFPPGV